MAMSSRMLKKAASGVLASFETGEAYLVKREAKIEQRESLLGTAAWPVERRVSARRGWAGEISSLFEHPEVFLCRAHCADDSSSIVCPNRVFPQSTSRRVSG